MSKYYLTISPAFSGAHGPATLQHIIFTALRKKEPLQAIHLIEDTPVIEIGCSDNFANALMSDPGQKFAAIQPVEGDEVITSNGVISSDSSQYEDAYGSLLPAAV